MTQQVIRACEVVDITGCIRCEHHKKDSIFMFCVHPKSVYQVGIKSEFHTCQHMRSGAGVCGPDKRLIFYV